METRGKEDSGSREQAAPGQAVQGHPEWIVSIDEGQLRVYFQPGFAYWAWQNCYFIQAGRGSWLCCCQLSFFYVSKKSWSLHSRDTVFGGKKEEQQALPAWEWITIFWALNTQSWYCIQRMYLAKGWISSQRQLEKSTKNHSHKLTPNSYWGSSRYWFLESWSCNLIQLDKLEVEEAFCL